MGLFKSILTIAFPIESMILGSAGGSSVPVTTNTNTGVTTSVTNDQNVYIPAQVITFEGHLLKPNTRLYVFFDGRNVSNYIKPTITGSENLGDPLVSTAAGYIKGEFHLPNSSEMRFTQGKKELKFTDSIKNNENEETTSASTFFTYSGSVDNTQYQDLGGIENYKSSADPLVQSFMVLDTGGVYLKGLKLYFLSKDSQFPILLQIREVVEDTVSESFLTNSNTILNPSDINVSTDGSVSTDIEFVAPVYLQEGKEYAIYAVTNAPATYTLATCIYGETDAYNKLSTRDPRIGGIMKHLGQGAWLKDTSKGIKFVLQKCAYDTTKRYTLALDNKALPDKLIDNNSIYTTVSTNIITIRDSNHSFNPNDFVVISGLPENTTFGGINSNYINGIHRIDTVTNNTYTFSNYLDNEVETLIPDISTASVFFGVDITTNQAYQYDTIVLNNTEVLLSNTKLEYTYKGLSGKSLDGSETPNVFDANFGEITNKVDYNTSRVKKVNSSYNESKLNPGGGKSLQVNIDFSTSNENITPVIDMLNTNAILIENIINNQWEDETGVGNGKGIARYITKDISLNSQSNGVQVRFYGNVQGNANVRVYYKTLPIDSEGTLEDQPWVEMSLDKEVSKANNATTFDEYVYTVYDISLFKAFKTKVLMTSPDSTKPPLISMYRAIAFQGAI